MESDTNWVIIGRFGRPHGIKGWVTVVSFTAHRENVLHYPDWHAKIKQQWQPIRLLAQEVHHKHILVQVAGYNERELASQLTNADIAIRQTALPSLEQGEYYWHELLGMKVVNPQGLVYGAVDDILSTGANDVLVVIGEKRYLIPYVLKRYIIDIDKTTRTITADWDMDFK